MSTTTARISTLESTVRELAEGQAQIIALLQGQAPAKAVTPKASKPRKASKPAKAVVTRHLVKRNRAEFVQAHAWAKGLSTLDIAIAVTHHAAKAPLSAGWAIGEGYTERALQATATAKREVYKAL